MFDCHVFLVNQVLKVTSIKLNLEIIDKKKGEYKYKFIFFHILWISIHKMLLTTLNQNSLINTPRISGRREKFDTYRIPRSLEG